MGQAASVKLIPIQRGCQHSQLPTAVKQTGTDVTAVQGGPSALHLLTAFSVPVWLLYSAVTECHAALTHLLLASFETISAGDVLLQQG